VKSGFDELILYTPVNDDERRVLDAVSPSLASL